MQFHASAGKFSTEHETRLEHVALSRLFTDLLRVDPKEVSVERRGFRCDNQAIRERLERIGRTFLYGYEIALTADPELAEERLDSVDRSFRGFAYEGASMGFALRDSFRLGRPSRTARFLLRPGAARYRYLVHVGAGWAMARIPWLRKKPERLFRQMDPLLRWLAVDGLGFHQGYFHPSRYIERQANFLTSSGLMRSAFDQGLGRSLWFIEGANAGRIVSRISTFPEQRQASLWSGAGLAAAYAGGSDRDSLLRLKAESGKFVPFFSQGIAFAAKARTPDLPQAPQTELACDAVLNMSASSAAAITDAALLDLPANGDAYQTWRLRIAAMLAPTFESATV